MPRKKKRIEPLFLMGDITRQEVHIGSSGNGTERYPLKISTYLELSGEFETPVKGTTDFSISIYEIAGTLQESRMGHGAIQSVKPVVYLTLWADARTVNRLVALITAKRLTSFYATADPTRYGQANIHSWSLRTSPEEE